MAAADGSALQRQLEAEGSIEVGGVRLSADDVELRATRHDAFALAEDAGWAVALDLDLTDALRREGTARELVRALNDLRKETGLAIADRIVVRLRGPVAVQTAIDEHGPWIAAEVLATSLEPVPDLDVDVEVHDIVIDDAAVQVQVSRV